MLVHGTPLPTPADPLGDCAGQDLAQFTVRMDAADPWLAWFEIAEAGRMDVFWPVGYGAQFGDPPTILDADGHVVFTDGELVTDSHPVCNGPDSSVIFEPED